MVTVEWKHWWKWIWPLLTKGCSTTELNNMFTAAFRLTNLYLAHQGTLYNLKKEKPREFVLTKSTLADIGEECYTDSWFTASFVTSRNRQHEF